MGLSTSYPGSGPSPVYTETFYQYIYQLLPAPRLSQQMYTTAPVPGSCLEYNDTGSCKLYSRDQHLIANLLAQHLKRKKKPFSFIDNLTSELKFAI